MPKKNVIIIFISLGVVLIGALVFILLANNNGSKTPEVGQMAVNGTKGSVIVKSFPENPIATSSDESLLLQTSSYDLTYFIKEQAFQIDLLAQPIKTTREQAEQALINYLQITQSDACNLKVFVKTPYSVDNNYAGLNLGLSFCPNSVTLK